MRRAVGVALGGALVACSDGVGLDYGRVDRFALSVAGTGSGSGTVVSSPAGIDCTITAGAASGTCTASYRSGTAVTLTATATDGSFDGWGGACSGTGTCQVTLDRARSVTASFAEAPPQLTVSAAVGNLGYGVVASSPAGVNCSIQAGSSAGQCIVSFARNTVVTLTATPLSGFTFTGWAGDCSGPGTCQLTMNQARSVTASFAAAERAR